MKLSLQLLGAIAFTVLAFPLPVLQAQEPPVPVVITPSAVQYKVIDLGKVTLQAPGTEAAVLERLLNDMAAQGWQLVATSGTLIILKR
ncbi:MAG TPA: hypothetical protein PLB55_09725 [Prosthecobacter sp.]|nr:hypothetical protein [Prosthecobacter sp.]